MPGVPYEMVRRTAKGRFAFVPSAELTAELAGVVEDAQRRWPRVLVHQCQWPSNHVHAVVSAEGPNAANVISAWLNFVMGESARVAKALYGLRGRIWERKRCRLIPILDDVMLRERTKYIMAQMVTAGCVARPNQWLGLNTCDALCRGAQLVGYRGNAALRRQSRREGTPMRTLAPRRVVQLSPLPSHADWPLHKRQAWYRAIEREIIEEAAADNPGRRYPPPEHYTTIDPNHEVALIDSPAPRCWVSSDNHEVRRTWRQMIRAFTDAWREALVAWVRGAKACFPPCGWCRSGRASSRDILSASS
jgi:hypothetical protein